jgi:hypothetical protein
MEDYDTACQYSMTREETTRNLWRLMLKPSLAAGMLLMLVTGILALMLISHRPLWVYGLVIFPLFFFFFMWRIVHRAVDQHPELLETQTLRFGPSGLSIANTVSTVQLPWSRVRGVAESEDFIVLRLDTLSSGAVVPKRALSEEERRAFLAYASASRT